MTLALIAVASADMEIQICEGPRVIASIPRHGDVEVPVDLAPVLVFDYCDASQTATVRLYEDDLMVLEEDISEDGLTTIFELDWEQSAGSSYHVRVTPSDGGEEVIIDWLVGEELLVESDIGPTISSVDEDRSGRIGTLYAYVDPGPQPNELPAIFELRDDDGEVLDRTWRWDAGSSVTLWGAFSGEQRFDACVTAFQRSPDGAWLEGDTHCESKVGCSTAGGVASLFAVLLSLLGLRRRK
ncbi:MAG TPA: MYXO-CTERM sorting domain-containing protein [Myxococcota bacterium]|nr:MYXO-CTERM sorting domain-containing protein [Myxococcota bacterium]